MLGRFLGRFWQSERGDAAAVDGAAAANPALTQDTVRSAIAAFLREPLAHPAVVDYELVARMKAAVEAADYMVARMMTANNLVRRAELLAFALGACSIPGLMLEFGVFRGESLRFLAKHAGQDVHGFDSFEGLPEDWTYFQKQGRFSLDGGVPEFTESNICVYKGWFQNTLPEFLAKFAGPARLVHIDCDIYSSTRTVFDLIAPRLVKGSVIVFDEYLGYPSWQQHEYRAFQEYVAANQVRYRYLGFASSHTSVAVVIE
jgi:hypothetical protein